MVSRPGRWVAGLSAFDWLAVVLFAVISFGNLLAGVASAIAGRVVFALAFFGVAIVAGHAVTVVASQPRRLEVGR